jgi:hypothetical protein
MQQKRNHFKFDELSRAETLVVYAVIGLFVVGIAAGIKCVLVIWDLL